MQINSNTFFNGRSHLTTSMPRGITIFSDAGKQFYQLRLKRIKEAERNNALECYRKFMENELQEVKSELIDFLENETMSRKFKMGERDTVGWGMYHLLTDKHSVLTYLLRKI